MRNVTLFALLALGTVNYSFASDDAAGAKALFYGNNAAPKLVATASTTEAVKPVSNNSIQLAVTDSVPAAGKKAVNTTKPKTAKPANLGLMAWVDMVDDNGQVQRVSSRREFRSGDAIRLNVQTNRTGYLYVVNLGSSGEARQLFPTQGKTVKVPAGKTYAVPGKGRIRFDSTPGSEEVLVLVSPKPLADMPQLKQVTYSAGRSDGWNKVALATGSKDLLVEEETDSLQPAVYAVDRHPVVQSGNAVSLRLSLNHR
ncbi:MAG: DUF4384 domain-containing protein [Pseudogulbenkiania sp.]|nr:DUF4384 domain-containing protein [Pseudogulbenkiania sp.]